MNREELARKVFEAGVVGAGGAGFPTHVKLRAANADTYLINGAECEPLVNVDRWLMEEMAAPLMEAGETVAGVLGARLVFAVQAKHEKAVAALRRAGAEVAAMRDYYPLGDEVLLIRDALDRAVPEGKLPPDVGVVVSNVETLLNIRGAISDRPVTHTFVSTGGLVRRPTLFRVPVGTNGRELLEASGMDFPQGEGAVVFVDGGPMMGSYRETPDFPVTKTTKALLALPRDSLLARLEKLPVETMLKQARVCCCQCNQCTLVCSRNLAGIGIEPHKIMRVIAYEGARDAKTLETALLCSECNLCSALHACPMGLSPRRVNQQIKKNLRANGVKGDFSGEDGNFSNEGRKIPHPLRDYRLVPSSRLKNRLGLNRYEKPVTYAGDFCADRVTVLMKQHAGAPATPIVEEGDEVAAGDCIAVPAEGALGARIHASLDGFAVLVSPESIVLQSKKQ
jgi:Na+-translocating ferredoxin:NAD+ oxidoreductase RnfC subunit